MSEEQKSKPSLEEPHEKPQELERIQKLERELAEYKDKYLRLLAEMENMRKRMQKEKQEATRFAVENVLAEILTPLDNFENALNFTTSMSEETRNWAIGFQMILSQFKDVLSNHGVQPFLSEGMHFDPHLHEAVEMEETDIHPEGTVLQEFIKGYKCGDRMIRPARVKVAKAPGKPFEEKSAAPDDTPPNTPPSF